MIELILFLGCIVIGARIGGIGWERLQGSGPSWSFDLGHMPIYQQKSSGYQYDLNHTLQCLFYFSPDFRKIKSTHEPAGNEE